MLLQFAAITLQSIMGNPMNLNPYPHIFSESIELPQDILQSVVEDAQDELATEFLDCCNATIDSIGPGQIYIDEDEGVTPGIDIYYGREIY